MEKIGWYLIFFPFYFYVFGNNGYCLIVKLMWHPVLGNGFQKTPIHLIQFLRTYVLVSSLFINIECG